MKTPNNDKTSQPSVLDVIAKIKEGRLDPRTLNKEERQVCVEVMLGEGVNAPTIAQIFKVNDKTIRRDIADIRLKNALTPSPEFSNQCAGEIWRQICLSRDHLMRLARSKDGSIGERAQAEMYAVQVFMQGVDRLQAIGYLPEKQLAVHGDVVLHNASLEDELKEWIKNVGPLAHQAGGLLSIKVNEVIAEVAQIIDIPKGDNHENRNDTGSEDAKTGGAGSLAEKDGHDQPGISNGS